MASVDVEVDCDLDLDMSEDFVDCTANGIDDIIVTINADGFNYCPNCQGNESTVGTLELDLASLRLEHDGTLQELEEREKDIVELQTEMLVINTENNLLKQEMVSVLDVDKEELLAKIRDLEQRELVELTDAKQQLTTATMLSDALVSKLVEEKDELLKRILKLEQQTAAITETFDNDREAYESKFEVEKDGLLAKIHELEKRESFELSAAMQEEKDELLRKIHKFEQQEAVLTEAFDNDRGAYEAKFALEKEELLAMIQQLGHELIDLTAAKQQLSSAANASDATVSKLEVEKNELLKNIYNLEQEAVALTEKFDNDLGVHEAKFEIEKDELLAKIQELEQHELDELTAAKQQLSNAEIASATVVVKLEEEKAELLKRIQQLEQDEVALSVKFDNEFGIYKVEYEVEKEELSSKILELEQRESIEFTAAKQEEKDELLRKISMLEQQVATLADKFEEDRGAYEAKFDVEKEDLLAKIQELEHRELIELIAAKQELSIATNVSDALLSKLEEEKGELLKKIQHFEQQAAILGEQFDNDHRIYEAKLEVEKDELLAKIEELEQRESIELTSAKQQLSSAKDASDALLSQLEVKKGELLERVQMLEQQKLVVTETFHKDREAYETTFENERGLLLAKIRELEQELIERTAAEQQLSSITEESGALVSKLEEEKGELLKKIQHFEQQEAALAEKFDNDLRTHEVKLDLEKEELLAKICDLEQRESIELTAAKQKIISAATVSDAFVSKLEEEKDELLKRINMFEQEAVALNEMFNNARRAYETKFTREKEELHAKIKELEQRESIESTFAKQQLNSASNVSDSLVSKLEEEKDDLLKKIHKLEQRVASLAEKFDNDRGAYEAKLDQYESELDDLANELELQININKKKNEKFEHEKAKLSASISDLESDNAAAIAKLGKLQSEIQRHIFDKKKLEAEAEDIRSKFLEQIDELDAEKEHLKEQLTKEAYEYEDKIEQLRTELENFQTNQTECENVSLGEMEKENRVLKERVSKLEMTNVSLAEKFDTEKFCYEEKLAHYESVLEKTALETDIDTLKETIRLREMEVAELNSQLANENRGKRTMADEVEAVREKYDRVMEKFRGIEAENGLLRSRLEQLNDQADKVTTLEKKIREFDADRRAKSSKLEFALKQARKWEAIVADASKEKESLEQTLHDLKLTNEKLAAEVATYSEQFERAKGKLDKQCNAMKILQTELDEALASADPYQSDVQNLVTKLRQRLSDDEMDEDVFSSDDNEQVHGNSGFENIEPKNHARHPSPVKRAPLHPRQMTS